MLFNRIRRVRRSLCLCICLLYCLFPVTSIAEEGADGWFRYYLEPGKVYDIEYGSSGWNSGSKIIINKGGSYWLKGKQQHVHFSVDASHGDVNLYLMDGLSIMPDNNATVFGTSTAAIEIEENGGTVNLISQAGAKITLQGYYRPAIQKDGVKTRLVFRTEDVNNPGTIIAKTEALERICAIGCYSSFLIPAWFSTTGNIEFASGNVEAYGAVSTAIRGAGPGIGASNYGHVDGIAFTGANVTAVGGDTTCSAIGTASAMLPFLVPMEDTYVCGVLAKNITITAGTVNASHNVQNSNNGGAGIGGGNGASAKGITISGGTVTAQGAAMAAGIGGGLNGDGLGITISGGNVTATGGSTGIGGGYAEGYINDSDSLRFGEVSVTITGGTVKATAADGVGIGGWKGERGAGTIQILGGNVTAVGGGRGAGIGGGRIGSIKRIGISGGVISAQGGDMGLGIGTALDEPNSVCREINITGGTLMAAGGNNITLQDHTKVSADVGGYAVSGWNSGRNVTPVYFSGGNLMLANQGSGVFRFEPRCDQTTTVYLNKLTLENYGDKISGGSHRLTELKAERSGAPYSSYGLNDVYLFSSAPELWLWLPDATTADAVTLSAPLTNRGDTYFSGKTTAKVGGTLYPKTNLILTAENPAVVEKEGSAFVSMNSGTAQEIVPPVLKHRTITDYHPLGSLPIMNRDGALYASQSPYTDASARWTGFGQSLYSNGLSLYAHSQPFQYNVAFDANKPSGASTAMSGSMGPLSMTYDVETQLTANGYALPGYQFTGWNTAADGQGTGYANQAMVKNLSEENGATVTLYAQWRAYSYQVHFDPNGGSGSMQAQQFTFDLPQKLTKNAFTLHQEHFVGWATNAFGKLYEDEEIVCNLCTLDSNGYPTGATLYAEWMSGGNATVWVTLNDEAYSNLTVELCEQTPGNPIRYRLPETAKGCYTAASGGALGIPAGTYDIKVTTDQGETLDGGETMTILDAQPNLCHLDYCLLSMTAEHAQSYGFLVKGALSHSVTALENHPVQVDVQSDIGYRFQTYTASGYPPKWKNNDPTIGSQSVIAMGKASLQAHMQAIGYSARFHANGGEGVMADQSMTYDTARTLSLNAFTREHYFFAGWTLGAQWTGAQYADGQSVKNLSSTQGAVVNLYAQWMPKPNYIRFYPNGGDGLMLDQKLFYGQASNLARCEYTLPDWHFTGWNTLRDGTGTSFLDEQTVTSLAGDEQFAELYAQWEHDVYYVRYESNDGSLANKTLPLWRNAWQQLDSGSFSRVGYSLLSWNTRPDGTGTGYLSGQPVYNLAGFNQTISLYAQWNAIPYTVVFDANGAMGAMQAQPMTVDASARLNRCLFQNSGKLFDGWNTRPDATGTAYTDQQEVVNLSLTGETVTLYAQWRIPAPQTGDHSKPAVWLIAAFLSGVGLVVQVRRKRNV